MEYSLICLFSCRIVWFVIKPFSWQSVFSSSADFFHKSLTNVSSWADRLYRFGLNGDSLKYPRLQAADGDGFGVPAVASWVSSLKSRTHTTFEFSLRRHPFIILYYWENRIFSLVGRHDRLWNNFALRPIRILFTHTSFFQLCTGAYSPSRSLDWRLAIYK